MNYLDNEKVIKDEGVPRNSHLVRMCAAFFKEETAK
tara:strand:- start:989 stop:1096 length:108 start_codon:yes stop_codon:yes gene_type:complete